MAQIDVPDELLKLVPSAAFGTDAPVTQPTATAGAEQEPEAQAMPEAGAEGAALPSMGDLGVETDPFKLAIEATNAKFDRMLRKESEANRPKDFLGGAMDVGASALLGVGNSIVETKNFIGDLIGQPTPTWDQMTPLERGITAGQKELQRRSGVNAFVGGTAQFVTGMIGVGKLMGLVKIGSLAEKGGALGKFGYELAKGAAAGAIVFDPNEDRLSNLIQQFPALQNPVTAYLADTDEDGRAEGRFKNALEGMGMDLVVAGVFQAAVKVFKFGKKLSQGDLSVGEQMDAAEKELADAVARAKAEAAAGGSETTVGGSPAKVVQAQPNVIDNALGKKQAGQDAQLGDTMDTLTKGEKPVSDAATTINRDLAETNKSAVPKLPGKNLLDEANIQKEFDTAPNPGGQPKTNTVADEIDDMMAEAKNREDGGNAAPAETGSKQDGTVGPKIIGGDLKINNIKVKISQLPKIETNGIGYKVIPAEDMHTIGKAYGLDTSKWLAAANPRTGEIWISSAVMKLPKSRQTEIIMHETGHTLEKFFIKRVTGKDGMLDSVPTQLKQEFEAASKMFRPDHWKNATDAATSKASSVARRKEGKDALNYLNHPAEMFADTFSMWKTRREDFGKIAPETAKLFDEHFMPWIDHDFGTHVGDLAALSEGVQGLKPGKAPRGPTEPIMVPEQQQAVDLAKTAKADDEAISKYGTREAAEANGYRFAKGANVPYQKLSDPSSVKNLIDRVAAEFADDLDNAKGGAVLSDARVDRLTMKLVDVFNEDPAQVMGSIQAAGREATRLVPRMEAAFAIAEKTAEDLKQLVKNNELGNYAEFGGDANLAEAAVPLRLAIHVEALAQAQSMRAALGRGMRRLRGDFRFKPELVDRIKTLSVDEAVRVITMANGDLNKTGKLLTPGWWDRWTRAAGSLYSNNLLWFWPTHVRNGLGNLWMLGTTPAMRAIGSFGLREGGQEVRKAAMREYRYMVAAFDDARQFAAQAYLKGDSILDPHNNEFFRDQSGAKSAGMSAASTLAESIGMKPMNTVGDFLGNTFKAIGFVFTQPNRVLGMSDEFMKQMSYRATIMAKASVEADSMVSMGTLKSGKDYERYIKSQLEASFDENLRAINRDAIYDAQVRTFSQPLLPGTIGKGVAGVVGANPILRLVLPFVRTPVNLFRYAIKLTPGLQLVQREYRQMLSGELGAARQADAYGQLAMGGLITASATAAAISGFITGGPPPGPQQAKALQDAGWKPYSFRVQNADGSTTYIPFSQLDPPGMLLGMVADVVNITKQGDLSEDQAGQLILPLVMAVSKNLTSKTYLQSLNDAIDAASGNDPQAMARFVGGIASGIIPMSSALRGYNPDPYLRDAKTLMDQVKAGIPGLSETLPPRRDWGGEPVGRQVGMVFNDDADNYADAENQRILETYGVGLTPLVATPRGDVDLRKFKLKDGRNAFDRYQELVFRPKGAKVDVKTEIGNLVKSADYAKLPDGPLSLKGTKTWAMQRILDKYRDAAYKQLLQENPDLAQATALSQQKVREAIRTGDKSVFDVSNQIKAANKAFGIGN